MPDREDNHGTADRVLSRRARRLRVGGGVLWGRFIWKYYDMIWCVGVDVDVVWKGLQNRLGRVVSGWDFYFCTSCFFLPATF